MNISSVMILLFRLPRWKPNPDIEATPSERQKHAETMRAIYEAQAQIGKALDKLQALQHAELRKNKDAKQ